MSELLDYLNSPNLVANFQKIFGVEANFCIQKQFLNSVKKRKLELQAKVSEKKKSKSMCFLF